MKIPIQRVGAHPDIPLPSYMTPGAAGMDLYAACLENVCLKSLERALIPTGFAIAVPPGYEAQIRPRSGLALKQGITCLNTPGTIDSDYRGEVGVILVNLSPTEVTIKRGDRIAQMVIHAFERAEWDETSSLPSTTRGQGGFGSTGHS